LTIYTVKEVSDAPTFEDELIARGESIMGSDPKTGVSQIYSAHNSLAFKALKSGDETAFRSHAMDMIRIVTSGFVDHGVPVHPEKQIPLLFVASAIGDRDLATQLAGIAPDVKHSHSFDIALASALRSVILGVDLPPRRYNPTKSEEGLFSAITSIRTPPFLADGASSYWRSTRNRRYSQTLFQHRDLFSEGLNQINQWAESGRRGILTWEPIPPTPDPAPPGACS